MKITYFAYGSNMSSARLEGERDVHFSNRRGGELPDWHLVFNKISATNPLMAVANIENRPGSEVRGILYDIDTEDLKIIDKYERAPEHYQRIDVRVQELEGGTWINAVTYKGTEAHTFKKGSGHPVDHGYFKWMVHAKKELGATWITRMMPMAQKFKNESYILDIDNFKN